MRLFKKGNKITFLFKFDQYTYHLRGVMVGILLKILPHGGGQILLMRVKFTLLGGQYYFNGGHILLGVKNTSMGGQTKFQIKINN